MFGYVTPLKDELKIREYNTFKSYYCGLCFHIKSEFGNLPRMLLNYDMTFLGLLLDSLTEVLSPPQMKTCVTNPLKKKPIILDSKALSYAAHMNVSLVYYKCLDDSADDKNLKSKALALALSSYKKRFSVSTHKVNAFIEEQLSKLARLEKSKDFSSIDEICEPFSLIVAHILKEYPHDLIGDDDQTRDHLFQFGYALGKWIYVIDALDDLEKDMKKNNFNPLNTLYNKNNEPYEILLDQIKEKVSFTLLNCGYNCKDILNKLPISKNKEILENIILLGMMKQYEQVIKACTCQNKKERNPGA